MWNIAFGSVCIFLVFPMTAMAGSSVSEQCNVRGIHVELDAPPGPAKSEMGTLIDAAFSKHGFHRTEQREDADAFLSGSIRIVDKMRDGASTFSATLTVTLTDKSGDELWQKKLEPYHKSNTHGTTRTESLEERANELAKKLTKACNKGWPKR
jgi:hypothetical protein